MDLDKFHKLLEFLRKGHLRADALVLADIHSDDWREWLAKAKNGVEPYASTCKLADIAEAECVDGHLAEVNRLAKKGNMKALEFTLKALRPERYREKPVEVNVNQQQALQLTTVEAKEKLYGYALELFRREPEYLNRLQSEFRLLPAANPGEKDVDGVVSGGEGSVHIEGSDVS